MTAATPLDAVSLWIEYYEIDPKWLPHLSEDTRIALCPAVAASAGVHLWDDIESWNVTADGGVGPFTPPDEIDRPAPHPRARATVMKGTH